MRGIVKMSDKTSDKLLPCPFCGGEAEIRYIAPMIHKVTGRKGIERWQVSCPCGICGCAYLTKEEVIAAWNTRKPMERIVERLEDNSEWTDSTFDEDGYCNDDSFEVIRLEKAIEIVKGEK